MRTVAIMQPYAFPYVGYFQLIRAVDTFVVLDDVAFIRRGFIHRNYLLRRGTRQMFTMPIVDASQNRRICDTKFVSDRRWRTSLATSLRAAYAKAPRFRAVFPSIEHLILSGDDDVSTFAVESIRTMCGLLGIGTRIVPSSRAYENFDLRGQDRIIDICVRERAERYVNPIGGTELYDAESFAAKEVELRFLRPGLLEYPQFGGEFVPGLSIIDVVMFNEPESLPRLLSAGEIS